MWENLLAAALLWQADLLSEEEYGEILNSYFLSDPEHETLLELEYCSTETDKTLRLLKTTCFQYRGKFNHKKFSRILCEKLEEIYDRPDTSLRDFSEKAYCLWKNLPGSAPFEAPLIELSYIKTPPTKKKADWADATYRTMFRYYREGCDKPAQEAGRKPDIKEFAALPPGTISLDWEEIETLLGFHLHESIRHFYSRAVSPPINGRIRFSEQDFLIPSGNKKFDTWFSFHQLEGAMEFQLLPVNRAEHAARFIRDSFLLWTGGNNFGKRTLIGNFFTNISDISILLNNDTGFVEWIDCEYGHFKTYAKNPNGIFAEHSDTFLEKLCRYSL